MPRLEWLLSFTEITFPIFLLVPSLVGALGLYIPLIELAKVYLVAGVQYVFIVFALVYGLVAEGCWLPLVFLIISSILVALGFFYVTKWTLRMQFGLYIERVIQERLEAD